MPVEESTDSGNRKTVEALTETDGILTVKSAIWSSTSDMIDQYDSDGKIDGEFFHNRNEAWEYARHQSYKIARQKTGRKLPEY